MAYKQLKLWFDEELATLLANKILQVEPAFPAKAFIKDVAAGTPPLELKPRVALIADALQAHLPGGFPEQIAVLTQILGPGNPHETGMFSEYYWLMPVAKFVETYGLDHFAQSMDALEAVTQRNTSEYAIRPFIEKYPEKTMRQMRAWSKHPNFHLRRLSCEGARPRLPWASLLRDFAENPAPLLPILENLKDDSSKYVQKSVANCLNDILKDNFSVGQNVLNAWADDAGKNRQWIIRHAIRNLRKKQNPWALEIEQKLIRQQ